MSSCVRVAMSGAVDLEYRRLRLGVRVGCVSDLVDAIGSPGTKGGADAFNVSLIRSASFSAVSTVRRPPNARPCCVTLARLLATRARAADLTTF